jgi:hypothetical protein
MANPSLVVTGTAAGIGAISTDVGNSLGSGVPAVVILTADYTLAKPKGYPTRPAFTGTDQPEYAGLVVTSGTTLKLLECEATALVNAGAATLVSAGS